MNDLLEQWTGLRLEEPWWLLGALLVPLALAVRHRRAAPDALLFGPALLLHDADGHALPRTPRTVLAALPLALGVCGLLLVPIALARPVARTPLPLRVEGRDVLLCLDTSSSMTVEDLAEERSRLAVAKEAAARFVAARRDDRIGLVTFARYPDVLCPPTLDHRALTELLIGIGAVDADSPEDATGIGGAVARCADLLRSSTDGARIVVVVTDGEENVATAAAPDEIAPRHAAQLCREIGVRVYAIAAGTDVDLDTAAVRDLAKRTGGEFFAAEDAAALERVYATIDALETAAADAPRFDVEERFTPVLVLALLLLVVGRVAGAAGLEPRP